MNGQNFIDEYGNFVINGENREALLGLFRKQIIQDKVALIFQSMNIELSEDNGIPDTNEGGNISILKQEAEQYKLENEELKRRLEEITNKYAELSGRESEMIAVKQVIIELRKQLGQGNTEADFSDEFPYTPISKSKK